MVSINSQTDTIKKNRLTLALSYLHHPQSSLLGRPDNNPRCVTKAGGIPGSSPLTACLNHCHLISIFSFGKRQKSQGAKSGLGSREGYGTRIKLLVAKN